MAHGPVAYPLDRALEAVPGWSRIVRFLDDVADGFGSGIALLWALRYYWLVIAIALIVTATQ